MKTKVNEIPLVGPKGRSELIKKINEYNENIDNRFKVLEEALGIDLNPDLDEKYFKYFTIEATQDETMVLFFQSTYAENENLEPLKIEVSNNDGVTWVEKTASGWNDEMPGTMIAQLGKGEKIIIRGRNKAYGFYSNSEHVGVNNCNFVSNKPCYAYGNIMSLIGGDDFARLRKIDKYAFSYFFSDYNDDFLGWACSKDGEELLLPATTIAEQCYSHMFSRCSNLTHAPKLPATILAERCYKRMFHACTNLVSAPELPATILADYCYHEMFYNCQSLADAPALPATTLVLGCYNSMFIGCALTSAPLLPATTLVDYCYTMMFMNCVNLAYIKAMFLTTPEFSYTNNWVNNINSTGTFVKNSAATWNVTGNNGVPTGWTVKTANN